MKAKAAIKSCIKLPRTTQAPKSKFGIKVKWLKNGRRMIFTTIIFPKPKENQVTKKTSVVKVDPKQTMMTRANFEEPRNFQELMEAAKVIHASGILPKEIDTPEKAAVVMLTGRELGIRMMASVRSVYIVNGKPALSAQIMLSLAYGTKELEEIEILEVGSGEASICTVIVKRKGKKPYSYTFSVEMAKRLQKYANEWLKQPENMCKQRAIAGNLRVTFPDAILGMYTPEEIESIEPEKETPMRKAAAQISAGEPIVIPVKKNPESLPLRKNDPPVVEPKPDENAPAHVKQVAQISGIAKQLKMTDADYLDFMTINGVKDPDKLTVGDYRRVLFALGKKMDSQTK